MSPAPLVVVTGAAGRLGRHVAQTLHEAGLRVRASDRVARDDPPFEFRICDLLGVDEVTTLVRGAEIIVHLGNHPTLKHPQTTFNENVAINMNVFQAAAEQGVRKIIFASTLQLIGSHVDRRTVVNPPGPLDYPLSGATEPKPANAYALSKTVSEQMLRYFAERCSLDGIAIRFPIILGPEYAHWSTAKTIDETIIREGFSCITFGDASRLVLATIKADLPGFRIYMPGTSTRCPAVPLPTLIRRHLPHLPDTIDNLIDNSAITRDTGWSPSDPSSSKR